MNYSIVSLGLDELLALKEACRRGELPPTALAREAYHWRTWARPEQLLPPGAWRYWVIKAGRGWGKTRTGAETVREWAKRYRLVNLIGATADDARDIMIEGESGLLAICPAGERPTYRKSDRQLVWPSGAKSLIFTADEPDRLRGKQHEKLWADELASWRYPKEAWDQAMLGLRLGDNPQVVVTTTPRPIQVLRDLLADRLTVVTGGTTYENRENLAAGFWQEIIKRYEGTRLGRQELLAELLEDNPDALWKRAQIEQCRVLQAPELLRIVIAVDPEAVLAEGNAETGIVAAGYGKDKQYYVLDDLSLRASPHGWASRAIVGYHRYRADRIVGEVNQGGDMVEHTLRTVEAGVPYKAVRASRGKQARAEPIAALYEQGKVHHVGSFPALEDQLCQWTPGDPSPDRLDALVWALTELSGQTGPAIWPI